MASPDYHLRLLGTASIEGPEGPLTGRPAHRNALALLALLAAARDRTLPREKLAAMLWPERSDKSARHLLNVTVYQLRQGLGEAALVTANASLRLDPDVVACDVDRFTDAIEDEAWDRAAELYGGPFLEGFHHDDSAAFEQWVERERHRNERLHLLVLERLAERADEAGDPDEAVARWRELSEREPASSKATIGLMRALERVDRRAEAIDVAHAHRILMLEEYGADPSPDVEELADRLREEPRGNGLPSEEETARVDRTLPVPTGSSWRVRVAAVAIMAAMVSVLVFAGSGEGDGGGDPGEPAIRRVLVAPLANETGDSTLTDLGLLAADFIAQELRATGIVEVLSPAQTRRDYGADADERPRSDVEMAAASGADVLVSGEIYRLGDSLVFQTRLVDPATGEILRAVREVRGPMDEPTAAVDPLRHRVTGTLAGYVDVRLAAWSASASQPPSFEAYQRFADGMDAFFRSEWETAAESFQRAAEIDSTFTTPLIWAMYAYNNRGFGSRVDSIARRLEPLRDRLRPWDRAQLDYRLAKTYPAKYDAMRRVVQVSPDSEWLFMLARLAGAVGRTREKLAILDSLEPDVGWMRNWKRFYDRERADALHSLGEYERELELAREIESEGRELRPLAALGRADEVLRRLQEPKTPTAPRDLFLDGTVRELLAHGHREAGERALRIALDRTDALSPEVKQDSQWRYNRGVLLMTAERWDEARPLFESILESDENADEFPILRVLLAICAVGTGDEELARQQIEWLQTEVDPQYPYRGTYQAAIHAHLGETSRAISLLRRSIGREAPVGPYLHAGLLYRPLWNDPEFREIIRPRG